MSRELSSICECENWPCQLGRCANIYGSLYSLVVGALEVSDINQHGESWDPNGEYPDLFVCWEKNDMQENIFCTSTKHNTIEVGFVVDGDQYETTVNSNDHFDITVWDEDRMDSEIIDEFTGMRIAVEHVRDGRIELSGPYARLLQLFIFRQ